MMRVYQTTILIPYLIAITVVAYLGLRLPVHRHRLHQQVHSGSLGPGAHQLLLQLLATGPPF